VRGRAHWIGLVAGGAILAFGIAGLARNHAQTMPGDTLRFLVGALVAHDLVWAWLVAGAAAVLVRVAPARVRPVVMGALATSAVLVLISVPALTGNGRLANNPSILPRDPWAGLAEAVLVTWLVAAVLAVRAWRRPPTAQDPPRPVRRRRQAGW
jgi:hypothetical protein